MTALTTRLNAQTPQGMLAACVSALFQVQTYVGPGGSIHCDVIDDSGSPAIDVWTLDLFGPDEVHFIAVWDSSVWPDPIPAAVFAGWPGCSGQIVPAIGSWNITYVTWDEVWDEMVTAIQAWMYIALSVGTVDVIDFGSTGGDPYEALSGRLALLLDGSSENPSYIVWAVKRIENGTGGAYTYQFPGAAIALPIISATTVTQLTGDVIGRIAEALEVLSLQDREISINRQSAAFNASARIIEGE